MLPSEQGDRDPPQTARVAVKRDHHNGGGGVHSKRVAPTRYNTSEKERKDKTRPA